ncbi:hypothetical protein K438DRAFT_1980618 [Mycena galopus ATCC 62051]|nr:hypothetical protein K438DRAFT_1980618 [Mycena galopus ATCC 62051]
MKPWLPPTAVQEWCATPGASPLHSRPGPFTIQRVLSSSTIRVPTALYASSSFTAFPGSIHVRRHIHALRRPHGSTSSSASTSSRHVRQPVRVRITQTGDVSRVGPSVQIALRSVARLRSPLMPSSLRAADRCLDNSRLTDRCSPSTICSHDQLHSRSDFPDLARPLPSTESSLHPY